MSPHVQRVLLQKNPNYVRAGLKSYGNLLRKYNITPTLDGPFDMIDEATGKKGHGVLKLLKKGVKGDSHHASSAPQMKLVKYSSATGTTGTVAAEDIQNDSEYLCPVSIGTPAQIVNLDFDTGSSDLWVWSTKLSSSIQSSGKSAGHVIFDPSKSSTFVATKTKQTWNISYGDGSGASGIVGNDKVVIGGVAIASQAVELADKLSTQFQQSAGDGLLGLAFGTINTVKPTPVKTPVENIGGNQLFSAYLGSWRDANDPDQGQSFYTFGAIDQSVVKACGGKINYTPVDSSNGFWQFPSTSTVVNGTTTTLTGNTAIADTGTTLAMIDSASCTAIYNAIPGATYDNTQQGYVFPANTTAAQLPVVQFAIGNALVTVQKEDYGFADAGNGMVYGSFQDRGNMPLSIYGDAVLKSMYAIFDEGNKQFGFCQRTEANQNLATPPS